MRDSCIQLQSFKTSPLQFISLSLIPFPVRTKWFIVFPSDGFLAQNLGRYSPSLRLNDRFPAAFVVGVVVLTVVTVVVDTVVTGVAVVDRGSG